MALKIGGSIVESIDWFQLDGHFHNILSMLYDARKSIFLPFVFPFFQFFSESLPSFIIEIV